MIKGTSVILHTTTQTGTDPFNNPIYAVTDVTVKNVIIGNVSTNEQQEK